MTETNLEKQIRDHYQSQELSPQSLERLEQGIAEAQSLSPARRHNLARWTAAAGLALLAMLAVVVLVSHSANPEQRIRKQLAEEAARDHNLDLGVELKTSDYADLRRRMSKLAFSPVEPDSFKPMHMRLLGARYSSLQGHPAVQMKLADSRGEICTLIQARPGDRLARVDSLTQHQVDGLLVDVWREKGLVMVLTRPIG